MYATTRKLAAALALAAALTGCNGQLPTTTLTLVKEQAGTSAAQRGTVRVALAGLGKAAAKYAVLATKADVHRLKLVLTHGGKAITRELGPKELAKALVYVDFDGVTAGKASLEVQAFDKGGKAIGKGQNGTRVVSGQTSNVHVNVKLDAETGNGSVNALITFEEAPVVEPPLPRTAEEAFAKADLDRDGWLSRKEFTATWPHAWGFGYAEPMPVGHAIAEAPAEPGVAEGRPAIMPHPMPCWDRPVTNEGQADADQKLIAPCLPHDPALADFLRRDANGDGRLSLDEFRGLIAIPMVAGQG